MLEQLLCLPGAGPCAGGGMPGPAPAMRRLCAAPAACGRSEKSG